MIYIRLSVANKNINVFIFQYGIKIPIFDIPRVLDYLQKVERLLILPPIMLSLTACKGPMKMSEKDISFRVRDAGAIGAIGASGACIAIGATGATGGGIYSTSIAGIDDLRNYEI